jgi:hypothetical protein
VPEMKKGVTERRFMAKKKGFPETYFDLLKKKYKRCGEE